MLIVCVVYAILVREAAEYTKRLLDETLYRHTADDCLFRSIAA